MARTPAPITPAQLSLSFLASRQALSIPIDSSSKVTASNQRHSMPTYSRFVYDAATGSGMAVWVAISARPASEKAEREGGAMRVQGGERASDGAPAY